MSISSLFKKLMGLKDCSTLEDLCAYIKPYNYAGLAYWISQTIWYTKDVDEKTDGWRPTAEVLKTRKGDCEELATVPRDVIRTWPGCSAGVMVVFFPKPQPSHAICFWWDRNHHTKGFINSEEVVSHGTTKPIAEIVKAKYPTATHYAFCNDAGKIVGQKVQL